MIYILIYIIAVDLDEEDHCWEAMTMLRLYYCKAFTTQQRLTPTMLRIPKPLWAQINPNRDSRINTEESVASIFLLLDGYLIKGLWSITHRGLITRLDTKSSISTSSIPYITYSNNVFNIFYTKCLLSWLFYNASKFTELKN